MSNAMAVYSPTSINEAREFATDLANSGLMPKGLDGNPQAVFAILAQGAELNLPPMASLNLIAVIQGRPRLSPQGMIAVCLASPLCEYFHLVEGDATSATWETKRRGAPGPSRSTWSMADAKTACLTTDMWRKYPKQMVQWRAAGFLARQVYPDIVGGLYTTDEAEDFEDRPSRPEPRGSARVEQRTERPRVAAAETVAKRAEMLRRGSAPPAAGVVEDAEVVRTGRDQLMDALFACELTQVGFDKWCANNGRPVFATMDHGTAAQAADWLLGAGAEMVKRWHTDRAKAAPKAKASAPAEPIAPHPEELEAALKDVGIPAALADAWAQHKGYKPATAAGARALWFSIMEPADGEWSAFMAEWDRANTEADAEAVPTELPPW